MKNEKLKTSHQERIKVLNTKEMKEGERHARISAWNEALNGGYDIGALRGDIAPLAKNLFNEGKFSDVTEKCYIKLFYKESLNVLYKSWGAPFQAICYLLIALSTAFIIYLQ